MVVQQRAGSGGHRAAADLNLSLRLEDVLRAETVLVLRPALERLAARATVGGAE